MRVGKEGTQRFHLPGWDSIASHLVVTIAMLVLLVGGMGLIAVWRADRAAQANSLAHDKYEVAAVIDRTTNDWLSSSSITAAYLLLHDPSYPASIKSVQEQTLSDIDRAIDLETQLGEVDDVNTLRGTRGLIVFVQQWTTELIDATNAGDTATAQQLSSQIITEGSVLVPQLNEFADRKRAEVSEASAESASAARTLEQTLVVSVLALLLLGAGATFYLTRTVMRPLSSLRRAASAIGNGDLSVRAEVHGPREIRDLAAAFNHTIGQIEDRDRALRTSESY